jgi:hypothetical protein
MKPLIDDVMGEILPRCLDAAQGGPNPAVPAPERETGLATVLADMVNAILGTTYTARDCTAGRAPLLAVGAQGAPGRLWMTLRLPPSGPYGVPELEVLYIGCPFCPDRGFGLNPEVKVRALVTCLADIGHAFVGHVQGQHMDKAERL